MEVWSRIGQWLNCQRKNRMPSQRVRIITKTARKIICKQAWRVENKRRCLSLSLLEGTHLFKVNLRQRQGMWYLSRLQWFKQMQGFQQHPDQAWLVLQWTWRTDTPQRHLRTLKVTPNFRTLRTEVHGGNSSVRPKEWLTTQRGTTWSQNTRLVETIKIMCRSLAITELKVNIRLTSS